MQTDPHYYLQKDDIIHMILGLGAGALNARSSYVKRGDGAETTRRNKYKLKKLSDSVLYDNYKQLKRGEVCLLSGEEQKEPESTLCCGAVGDIVNHLDLMFLEHVDEISKNYGN